MTKKITEIENGVNELASLVKCQVVRSKQKSKRALAWRKFAEEVERHIEEYTVPQYGDAGEDQVTEWDAEDCLKNLSKYRKRYGKNARPGQQDLDFVKMAHYVQLAAEKHGGR
jgi:hypothetical protein